MPFNRGILGKYASTSSISGLVTAKEQFTLAAGGFYPRFATTLLSSTILNSNYTSLLIKATGNSGTNSSITDSSTNAHTVSVYGNAQATSFSPYRHGGYSAYIDGSGSDWLKTDTHADFAFGTGDFTVECWYYPVSKAQNYPRILHFGTFWQNNQAWGIHDRHNSYSTKFSVQSYSGAILESTTTVTNGKWYHVAVERSGTTITLYINGIAEDTYNISTNNFPDASSTSYLNIGNVSNGANLSESEANGYVKDVRIVKGNAVYQGNFTPPTSTLRATTNTVFLGLTKPYYTDASGQGHTLTPNGSITHEPFSPYDRIEYSTSTHGGSVYLDGTGDYLAIADDASLEVGSGDFTLEGWFYPQNTGYNVIVSKTSAAYAPYWVNINGGTIYFYASSTNTGWDVSNGTTFGSPKINTWNHFAISRSSSSIRLFLNGVLGNTITSSAQLTDHASPFTVGSQYNGGTPLTGWISDIRLVKGTAVYTSAFTPPTSPLTAITNTSVLISGTDASVYDASQSSGTLTLVGNAASSTTQTKYASSSVYFDGTGDYITAQMDDFIISEDEDWTVEFWAYISNVSADNAFVIFGPTDSGTGAAKVGFGIFEGGTKLAIVDFSTASNNKNLFGNSTQLSSNTWHHIAFVKSGNQVAVFIDGTIDSAGWVTFASSITLSNRARAHIGGVYNLFLNGYLEDVRITKGLARYPFIPAKETLTADANTILLTAHSSSIEDGSENNASVSTVGNAAVSTFAPKSGMYSVDFDGNNDALSIANPYTTFGSLTGDYTIECWVNMDAVPAGDGNGDENQIIGQSSWPESGTSGNWWTLFAVASGVYYYTADGSSYTAHQATDFSWTVGKWTHIAVVKSSGTVYVYIDGQLQTSGSNDDTIIADNNRALTIGNDTTNTNDFNGQISNLRVSNTVRYTNSFTPPTAALT